MNTPIWWSKDWESVPGTMLDISAGGMLCEFPREMLPGAKVNLQLDLPGFTEMILCRAKIVHCRPGETNQFLVGLSFIELEGINPVELVRCLIDKEVLKQA